MTRVVVAHGALSPPRPSHWVLPAFVLGLALLAQPALGHPHDEPATVCEPGAIEPTGDADGDGVRDDALLQNATFANARVEVWCVDDHAGRDGDGRADGYYLALLVQPRSGGGGEGVDGDGTPRLAGKCAWPFAANTALVSVAREDLRIVEWRSTDVDRPSAGYEGSGDHWAYRYVVGTGALLWEKHEPDGNVGRRGVEHQAPERPFAFHDLPGGETPRGCTIGPAPLGGGSVPPTVPAMSGEGLAVLAVAFVVVGTRYLQRGG